MGTLTGKTGLVMGVANERSIAWAISEALYEAGAELAFTHLPGESSQRRVRKLLEPHAPKVILPCDVQRDEDLARVFDAIGQSYGTLDFLVHSIAFAPPEELRQSYLQTSRGGWHLAMDVSVYSLVASCRAAAPLMGAGGSVVTISYYGGEKVVPGYNVMGVCKAALEHSVRYLAWDLGGRNVRVNAVSAGPLRTLSTAGISRFDELRGHAARKSPLRRSVEPGEIGAAALYLLSPQSHGVTGETLHVDCGYNVVGL